MANTVQAVLTCIKEHIEGLTKDMSDDEFAEVVGDLHTVTMRLRARTGKSLVSFPELVDRELTAARANFRDMASAHEAFAILKEEVDELWERVRMKQADRTYEGFEHELVQVAAMAQRFAEDIVYRCKLGE